MALPELALGLPMSGEHVVFDDRAPRLPSGVGDDRRDAAVLFVEVAHADALSAGRSAQEVGALLGAFFRTVREVTEVHGGYVDRGDLCALQCVFAAPASSTHAADSALSGARELRDRLAAELPDVPFSVGISVGASVPGWIEALRRFEPLAICAPLSEARRLSDLARRAGSWVVASQRALSRASAAEAGRWASGAPA